MSSTKYVLIDDDDLIHTLWKMSASLNNKEIQTFFSVEEFEQIADRFCFDTCFFIDSNLANGLKGEIESERLYKLGFKNIYLATGSSPEKIEKPEWIKGVLGKRPVFPES